MEETLQETESIIEEKVEPPKEEKSEDDIKKQEKGKNLGDDQNFFIKEVTISKENIEIIFKELLFLLEEDDTLFGKVSRLKKIFDYKLVNLIISFIETEGTVLNSSSTIYYKTLLNDQTQDEMNENKILRQFDSFLAQYFSLLDIFIKKVSNLFEGEEIDGWGILQGKEESLTDLQKKIFKKFLSLREELNKFKAYRDYLVHHGKTTIQSSPPEEGNEFLFYQYHVLQIEKKGGRSYTRSKKWMQRINYIMRINLSNLLICLNDALLELDKHCLKENK